MSAVGNICKFVRVACEGSEVINSAAKSLDARAEPVERTVDVVLTILKALSLGANCTEFRAQLKGASNATLHDIKTLEAVARLFQIPFEMCNPMFKGMNEGRDFNWKELGQSLLTPTVSFLRAANEQQMYQEQAYLDMSPEELSKARRITTDEDGTVTEIRPVVREECEAILKRARSVEPSLNAAEVLLRTGGVTRIANNLTEAYGRLAQRLQAPAVPLPAPVPPHPLAMVGIGVPAVNQNVFDLLALPLIPLELQNDIVFRRYICPISQEPIRHPVGLPGEPHLFERSVLTRWIRDHGTSPISRQRVRLNQIVGRPAIQALINHRLEFHQQRLIQHTQQGLNIPGDPALVAAAAMEE